MLAGWWGLSPILPSLRNQAATILLVSGCCHISSAKACHIIIPNFKGMDSAFLPQIRKEVNLDICQQL